MLGRFKVSTVSLSRNLIFIETVKIEWNVKDKRSMKEPQIITNISMIHRVGRSR